MRCRLSDNRSDILDLELGVGPDLSMLKVGSRATNLGLIDDAPKRCRCCRCLWRFYPRSRILIGCFLVTLSLVTFLLLRPLLVAQVPVPTLHNEPAFPFLTNLVMVAGHSVYLASNFSPGTASNEDAWYLLPYQKENGQAASFIEMIEEGVKLTDADTSALLLFSGGVTRKAGPLSEGESLWRVANGADWYGHARVQERAAVEDYARDSFENFLFSLCRFKELTGKYPINVTVVSYTFKRPRFEFLHRKALRFPHRQFFFAGTHAIGSPYVETADHLQQRQQGEATTLEGFKQDPYGCFKQLREKKQGRNPFSRTIPYSLSCPELSGFFEHCGPAIYDGALPWATKEDDTRTIKQTESGS